jgi:phosphoribosylglycinamide formyltransferase 2
MRKVMMLGSGELGKEVVIALKRLGCTVIACDAYRGAPAMQVADDFEVFSMLDAAALDAAVAKHQPDIIVPEVESIRTDRLYAFEQEGIQVTPSAKAANFTMNRKLIRDLAAKELGLKTAPYAYATSLEEFEQAVAQIGLPCVVKPLMSSSGKGQSVVREAADLQHAFTYAMEGSRGDLKEIIVEGFVDFHSEITLLTVSKVW